MKEKCRGSFETQVRKMAIICISKLKELRKAPVVNLQLNFNSVLEMQIYSF